MVRGDKSLEEVPSALKEAGREVREVTVYETAEEPKLSQRVSEISKEIHGETTVWLAFFSPSSAKMVLPHIRSAGLLDRTGREVRVAAIGETTRRFLEGGGWLVDAIAAEPNAEGLFEAIRAAEDV